MSFIHDALDSIDADLLYRDDYNDYPGEYEDDFDDDPDNFYDDDLYDFDDE